MGRNGVLLLFCFLALAVGSGSAAFTTGCPLNFEFMNYTVITGRCKGPRYPPDLCCQAFKEFACPYADEINDVTNDCATTMFSYINLYGKYPPGLFASECREGKNGLECPENATRSRDDGSNSFHGSQWPSHLPIFVAGAMSLLIFFF